MHGATDAVGVRIDLVEDDGLRIHVQVERKGSRQRDTDRLGVPAGVLRDVAKYLLHQDQAKDRQGHRAQCGKAGSRRTEVDVERHEGLHRQRPHEERHADRCKRAAQRRPVERLRSHQQQQQKREPEAVARHIGQCRQQPKERCVEHDPGRGEPTPQRTATHRAKQRQPGWISRRAPVP